MRPRPATPPIARPTTSSPTPNPPSRRFPAAMSYPPLSDKARTPAARPPVVTPGQPRAAASDTGPPRAASAPPRQFAAPPPSPATAAGRQQQPVNRVYNPLSPPLSTAMMGGRRGVPPAESLVTTGPMSAPAGAPPGRGAPGSRTGTTRTALDVGDSYPPISGRSAEGFGNPNMDRRITPRSPRAALEPEHVPEPTRRSKRVRNPLVIIGNAVFMLLILLVLGGGVAVVFAKVRLEAPGPLQADKIVNIPKNARVAEIADLLQREGVVDEHKLVFMGGVAMLKAWGELKSGEYLFPKRASVRDVVETMVEGKVVQHLIAIPEGLTSEQIAARLLDSQILTGTIKATPREGSMLPNSYAFRRGDTREQAIQRMQLAQQQIVKEAWERRARDLPLRTPEQLVILASIIEKETSRPEERTRIAAVFANRLKQRIRLQTDPTVIYGLAPGKGALGRPLSRADLERPTPYNTYIIDALPPGPIANPGRASIEAAANPARTKELYFVADGTGGHAFAESYDQHQRNVARLRTIEQGGTPEPPRETQESPTSTPKAAAPKRKKAPAKKAQPQ